MPPKKRQPEDFGQGMLLPPPAVGAARENVVEEMGVYYAANAELQQPLFEEVAPTEQTAPTPIEAQPAPATQAPKVKAPKIDVKKLAPSSLTERGQRLQSLLTTMDLIGKINSAGAMERSQYNPDARREQARRYGGEIEAANVAISAAGKIPQREAQARRSFAHATSHDKRLERMPEEKATAVTSKAYGNLVRKYYPNQPSKKAEKARSKLRRKITRQIKAEILS